MEKKDRMRIYLLWILILTAVTAACLFIQIPVAEKGNPSAFVAYLDAFVPRFMEKHEIGGAAISLISEGRIIHLKGYGFSDAESGRPVTGNTVFKAASVSKALTAWGVMHLAERGVLGPDRPVSDYLTRFRLPDSNFDLDGVTIRRLLSHSAGIAHVGGYAGFESMDDVQSLEASLIRADDARGEGVRIVRRPGTKYRYSGGGFTLLQLVIEEVTGQPFETFMKDSILAPLSMETSGFELTPRLRTSLCEVCNSRGEVRPVRYFTARAAAGLYTTAGDLSLWALSKMASDTAAPGRGILKPETLESMFRPQQELNSPLPYGLG